MVVTNKWNSIVEADVLLYWVSHMHMYAFILKCTLACFKPQVSVRASVGCSSAEVSLMGGFLFSFFKICFHPQLIKIIINIFRFSLSIFYLYLYILKETKYLNILYKYKPQTTFLLCKQLRHTDNISMWSPNIEIKIKQLVIWLGRDVICWCWPDIKISFTH